LRVPVVDTWLVRRDNLSAVSFYLLSSTKENNRLAPMRADIKNRTNGFKRRCESVRKNTQVLAELVAQAKTACIAADYLLFDSWFSFPATIISLLEEKIQHLHTQGDEDDLQLPGCPISCTRASARGLAGHKGASCMVTLGTTDDGLAVMAKIVFVRD
jgi:hypothetical protein